MADVWTLFSVFFMIFTVLLGLSGVLRPVDFEDIEEGPYQLFYKEYVGPYPAIGGMIREIANIASRVGMRRLAGVYFDNPKEVADKDKCRAYVGVACTPDQAARHRAALLKAGLKEHAIPKTKFIACIWPMAKGLAFLCLPIALSKIYRNAEKDKDIQESSKGVLEIYLGTNHLKVCFAQENAAAFTHPADSSAPSKEKKKNK